MQSAFKKYCTDLQLESYGFFILLQDLGEVLCYAVLSSFMSDSKVHKIWHLYTIGFISIPEGRYRCPGKMLIINN